MKKYVTIHKSLNGKCYSEISSIMTKGGDKMNHQTVKNIINKGLVKIVNNICKEYEFNIKKEDVMNIVRSREFQLSIMEVLRNNEE